MSLVNFALSIEQAKEGFFDRAGVINQIDATTRKFLTKFGAFTRTRARSSLRTRKGISAPGERPNAHKGGKLKRGILFSFDRATKSVTIGPTRWDAARLTDPPAPELLELGGERIIARPRIGRPAKHVYRPRPFMRPAFEAELENKQDTWAKAAREAHGI